MTLKEVLKVESMKNDGKPLMFDAVKKQMNVSSDEWMNALIELVMSGDCILSTVTSGDGNSISMIKYIPSVSDESIVPSSARTEPSAKACTKSTTRGRPRVSPELKRVVINHVRLPLWLSEHLKDRGNSGRTVEKALIEYYCLSPPC